jgi:hypothetical protein
MKPTRRFPPSWSFEEQPACFVQTIGAQLHHQPTLSAVENAEHKANAQGEAALEQARKADASA